jgi:hypothetical protein
MGEVDKRRGEVDGRNVIGWVFAVGESQLFLGLYKVSL